MNEKEKELKNNGKGTNVGNALRWLGKQGKEFAPELLDIVGAVTGVKSLNALGDVIRGDKDISEEDKELLLKEATKRLQSDNQYVITRLVRPLSFLMMLILFIAIVIFDGNVGEFVINEAYIPVIQSLFSVMVIFYFSSRGIEKISKIIKKD